MGIISGSKHINSIKMHTGPANGKMPKLSKSRFVRGLQCLKALFYECYHYDYRDELTEEQKKIFKQGTSIGVEAQKMFPGGILIDEDWKHPKEAIKHTEEALNSASSIYEAAFDFEDIVIRADILVKNDDGWDMIEVKSTKSVKDVMITDVGTQLFVLNNNGIKIKDVYVMHMSPSFDYQNPDFSDIEKVFVKKNVNAPAHQFAQTIPSLLKEMKETIKSPDSEPAINIGEHCEKPYICPFYGHCHKTI